MLSINRIGNSNISSAYKQNNDRAKVQSFGMAYAKEVPTEVKTILKDVIANIKQKDVRGSFVKDINKLIEAQKENPMDIQLLVKDGLKAVIGGEKSLTLKSPEGTAKWTSDDIIKFFENTNKMADETNNILENLNKINLDFKV